MPSGAFSCCRGGIPPTSWSAAFPRWPESKECLIRTCQSPRFPPEGAVEFVTAPEEKNTIVTNSQLLAVTAFPDACPCRAGLRRMARNVPVEAIAMLRCESDTIMARMARNLSHGGLRSFLICRNVLSGRHLRVVPWCHSAWIRPASAAEYPPPIASGDATWHEACPWQGQTRRAWA